MVDRLGISTPDVATDSERAHAESSGSDPAGASDDAMLVEALGHAVLVYESDAPNPKITTPHDLIVAEALLAKQLSERQAERPAGSRR